MIPKGPLGIPVKNFLMAKRPSSVRRQAALLRYYTGLRLKSISEKQRSKALGDITSPRPSSDDQLVTRQVLSELDAVKALFGVPDPDPKTFFANVQNGTSRYYSPVPLPRDAKELYYGSFIHSLLTTSYFPKSLRERLHFLSDDFHSNLCGWYDKYVGKITILQEAGCKARVVAQPNAWCQMAFAPLHDIVSTINAQLPGSHVVNQVDGIHKIIAHLGKGGKAYSIDLSAATDRLPRKLQCRILESMGLKDYAEGLEKVSRNLWDFPGTDGVSYKVGQPMGLRGSFPLLNFTNWLIARSACTRCNREWDRNFNADFVVVGDDIVFFDEAPAEEYRRMMHSLGVEISSDKSFSGGVSQFAGFWTIPITPGKYIALRPYKYPEEDWVSNPIDFLNAIGSKVKHLKRSDWWSEQFRLFEKTEHLRDFDLSPLIRQDNRREIRRSVDARWTSSVFNKLAMIDSSRSWMGLEPHYKDISLEFFETIRLGSDSFTTLFENREDESDGYKVLPWRDQVNLDKYPLRRTRSRLDSDPLMRDARSQRDNSSQDVILYRHVQVKEHTRLYRYKDGRTNLLTIRCHTRRYRLPR